MSSRLNIEASDAHTLQLVGEVDLSTCDLLRDAVMSIPGPVNLDCSGVTFMDSTGLRLIAERLGLGPVTIVAPSERVERLLVLCGWNDWPGLTVAASAQPQVRERLEA